MAQRGRREEKGREMERERVKQAEKQREGKGDRESSREGGKASTLDSCSKLHLREWRATVPVARTNGAVSTHVCLLLTHIHTHTVAGYAAKVERLGATVLQYILYFFKIADWETLSMI